MSGTRELRERLEALQSGVNAAKAALASGPPEDFVAELEARSAKAQTAERAAVELEVELLANRERCAKLHDEVERGEQNVLAPEAWSSVPILAVLFTFGFLLLAIWALLWASQQPRPTLLMLGVKAVGLAAPLAFAWVVKRRLQSPARLGSTAPVSKAEVRRFAPKNRG